MFMFHAAMMLGLIAIALGVTLVVWSMRNEGQGIGMASIFGYIIIIVAILGEICNTYYSLNYWHQGYFQTPHDGMNMTSKQKDQ